LGERNQPRALCNSDESMTSRLDAAGGEKGR